MSQEFGPLDVAGADTFVQHRIDMIRTQYFRQMRSWRIPRSPARGPLPCGASVRLERRGDDRRGARSEAATA